jgi:hypothetical protein
MACKKCNSCTDTGCLKFVPSDCVQMSKAYPCLDLDKTDLLTKAFDRVEALCNNAEEGLPCNTYTTATLVDPQQDLVWAGHFGTVPQYSDKLNCKVTLRGQCQADIISVSAVDCQLFVLPAAQRPAIQKIIPTVVQVHDGGVTASLFVGAVIIIKTSGAVDLVMNNFNPIVAVASGCADCAADVPVASYTNYFGDTDHIYAIVSLDGIVFDTNS